MHQSTSSTDSGHVSSLDVFVNTYNQGFVRTLVKGVVSPIAF